MPGTTATSAGEKPEPEGKPIQQKGGYPAHAANRVHVGRSAVLASSKITTSQASFCFDQVRSRSIIQRVSGLEALELADRAAAQRVEIADGVEDLVFDEFVS